MRQIWATTDPWPFTAATASAAAAAGACEIVELPVKALPNLTQGYNVIPDDLAAYNAAALSAKESAGITVDGVAVATDPVSQGRIAGAYNLAQININTSGWTFNWPLKSGGFQSLTAVQITSIATTVGSYIQSVMACGSANAVAIASGAITTTAQIDAAYAAVSTSF